MRSLARWVALHGAIRLAARYWAAHGDPHAKLIAADEQLHADPFGHYEQVRGAGAVNPTRIGFITASHEVTNTVLRSDEFCVAAQRSGLPPLLAWLERHTRPSALHPLDPPSLLAVEPPAHTRYRALVSSVFTARAVAGMRTAVQAVADALLDELLPDARADTPIDLVERFCAPLPVTIISDLLGVPEGDRAMVLGFGEQAAPSLDIGLTFRRFRGVQRGLAGFDDWLGHHLSTLRRNPGADLMSQLIRAELDNQHLNEAELRATAGLVLVAGFETTVNLLGNGVRLLAAHPEQLTTLGAEPRYWPNALEEVLRVESPVQITARLARQQTELAGVPIPAGGIVAVLLGAANRDPVVFTEPERFDVRRTNADRHVAFSGGRHYCLGAALARLEGEIALRSLFERYPHLQVLPGARRRPTRVLRGWASLPVRLGPPARPPEVVRPTQRGSTS